MIELFAGAGIFMAGALFGYELHRRARSGRPAVEWRRKHAPESDENPKEYGWWSV